MSQPAKGLYSIKSGVPGGRVKFAEGQGMHGSVWLQSGNHSEIDMIESTASVAG